MCVVSNDTRLLYLHLGRAVFFNGLPAASVLSEVATTATGAPSVRSGASAVGSGARCLRGGAESGHVARHDCSDAAATCPSLSVCLCVRLAGGRVKAAAWGSSRSARGSSTVSPGRPPAGWTTRRRRRWHGRRCPKSVRRRQSASAHRHWPLHRLSAVLSAQPNTR